MAHHHKPKVTADGLIFYVDPLNPKSKDKLKQTDLSFTRDSASALRTGRGMDFDGSFEVWVDSQSQIINTSGSPTISNNHIEWNFTGLQALQHLQQTINIVIPASPGVVLIDSARITPILPNNSFIFW